MPILDATWLDRTASHQRVPADDRDNVTSYGDQADEYAELESSVPVRIEQRNLDAIERPAYDVFQWVVWVMPNIENVPIVGDRFAVASSDSAVLLDENFNGTVDDQVTLNGVAMELLGVDGSLAAYMEDFGDEVSVALDAPSGDITVGVWVWMNQISPWQTTLTQLLSDDGDAHLTLSYDTSDNTLQIVQSGASTIASTVISLPYQELFHLETRAKIDEFVEVWVNGTRVLRYDGDISGGGGTVYETARFYGDPNNPTAYDELLITSGVVERVLEVLKVEELTGFDGTIDHYELACEEIAVG